MKTIARLLIVVLSAGLIFACSENAEPKKPTKAQATPMEKAKDVANVTEKANQEQKQNIEKQTQ